MQSLKPHIEFPMSINLNLKGLAYIDGCETIFIEVHGKSNDCIEAILVAKIIYIIIRIYLEMLKFI